MDKELICPVCKGTHHKRRTIQRTNCWQIAVGRHRGFAFRDKELPEEDKIIMKTMQEFAGKLPY